MRGPALLIQFGSMLLSLKLVSRAHTVSFDNFTTKDISIKGN